jgi:hypothetical protein
MVMFMALRRHRPQRACGTPRLFGSIACALEYWIARSSRAMTLGVWRQTVPYTAPAFCGYSQDAFDSGTVR